MKIYSLPQTTKALVFDMDLTLYSNAEYGRIQIERLTEIAGRKRGFSSLDETKREIKAAFEEWAASHNGEKASLSNIILSWGFTMEENIRWREEAYNPEEFLKTDSRLRETLKSLSASFELGVVTNNPLSIARRTLAAIGVEDLFKNVVALDTCMVPKPHRLPFITIAKLMNVPLDSCVSIGDRYDIDLALPLEMGMGGILVDGVEDVYGVPKVFEARRAGGN